MRKKSLSKLRSLLPAFFVMIVAALFIGIRAYADTTNFYTGCIKNGGTHNLYNVQLGTSPTTPCSSGDTQVSADYGDITAVTAGTGLSGGATQGAAVLSLADNGVTTTKIASSSVTAVKINSESATNGKVLTANGSGGATWQTPASGAAWGSITGTLSNQTDLQNALNAKQDKLVAFNDKHHLTLTNNTETPAFSFSLANGEGIGISVHFTVIAKRGSDWGIESGYMPAVLFNDGGTLQYYLGSIFEADKMTTGSDLSLTNSYFYFGTPSLNSGVVTITFSPGSFASNPDSIDLYYTITEPSGKPLTFF